MVEDMVLRRIRANVGRNVAATPRRGRLPAGSGGRAGLGAVVLLVLSAGVALGGTAPLLLALGGPLGVA
jgi:hypothetical protein